MKVWIAIGVLVAIGLVAWLFWACHEAPFIEDPNDLEEPWP